MEEFKVPKQRVSVLVAIPPQPPEPRIIFLSPTAQNHQGAETASDIFNVRERFLPLFRENGEVTLTRRDAICWVRIGDPRQTEWLYYTTRMGVADSAVCLHFDNGSMLEGRVALIAPVGGQRVIDIVNRQEGFLHLERDGDDLFLVNLGHVASIAVKE